MPKYIVKLRCESENLQLLRPRTEAAWSFDISSSDDAFSRSGITVCQNDVIDLEDSRGQANFVVTWSKGSSAANMTMKILQPKDQTDYSKFVPFLELECRGLVPTKWIPGSGDFDFISTGDAVFEAIDLSEKEWADYDEKNDASVSITDLEWEIQKV